MRRPHCECTEWACLGLAAHQDRHSLAMSEWGGTLLTERLFLTGELDSILGPLRRLSADGKCSFSTAMLRAGHLLLNRRIPFPGGESDIISVFSELSKCSVQRWSLWITQVDEEFQTVLHIAILRRKDAVALWVANRCPTLLSQRVRPEHLPLRLHLHEAAVTQFVARCAHFTLRRTEFMWRYAAGDVCSTAQWKKRACYTAIPHTEG